MPSPNKQTIINQFIKEVAKGTTYSKVLAHAVEKWHISKRTFDRYWKTANEQHKETQDKAKAAAEKAIVDETVAAARNGLKSKLERVINLQRQVDDIQKDLDSGITVDYVIISGKLQRVQKEMSVADKAYCRRVIKDIQSEISKIEGDYAETAIKLKGDRENPISSEVIVIGGRQIKF